VCLDIYKSTFLFKTHFCLFFFDTVNLDSFVIFYKRKDNVQRKDKTIIRVDFKFLN